MVLKYESDPLMIQVLNKPILTRAVFVFVCFEGMEPRPSGSGCTRAGDPEKRHVKAAYLPSSSYSWYSSVKRVQVVVAMMPPPRTGAGVRNARCVAADGRTSGSVSAHLRPPGG